MTPGTCAPRANALRFVDHTSVGGGAKDVGQRDDQAALQRPQLVRPFDLDDQAVPVDVDTPFVGCPAAEGMGTAEGRLRIRRRPASSRPPTSGSTGARSTAARHRGSRPALAARARARCRRRGTTRGSIRDPRPCRHRRLAHPGHIPRSRDCPRSVMPNAASPPVSVDQRVPDVVAVSVEHRVLGAGTL
jgi:hypothetical protein